MSKSVGRRERIAPRRLEVIRMNDGVLFSFNADTNETVFPGCREVKPLITREFTFKTAHHISSLLQAMYAAGIDAGLDEAIRRIRAKG